MNNNTSKNILSKTKKSSKKLSTSLTLPDANSTPNALAPQQHSDKTPIYMNIVNSKGELIIDKFTNITPETLEILQELSEDHDFAKDLKKLKKKFTHKNQLGYIDPTVAGIDIGDEVIHVAFPNKNGGAFVEEFETTTPALHKLAQKLKDAGVTTAVMESTGVYWVPLYDILEDRGFKSVLVDAKSVKNVPGRKTDVVDAQWIQTLYSNGLLRAAFRPPRNRLKLRSLVRQRLNIIKNKQFALSRIEKGLQLMNIKLSNAVSEIAGVSGMNIIRAIVKGERNPVELAKLRNRACKKPEQFFIDALTGNFLEEELFSIEQSLAQFDFSDKQLKALEEKIEAEINTYPTVTNTLPPLRDKDKNGMRNFSTRQKPNRNNISFDVRTLLWQKTGIDFTALGGIEGNTALLVFAELGGTDVSAWKNVKHFSSWLKLCPGNNISGGKRRRSKKQPCSNYISQALRMSAMSAKRSRTALGAHIRRVCSRTDKPKGIKAGAHKLAHMLYYMCKKGWVYFEKGEDAYEKAYDARNLKNLEKKAKALGMKLVAV